MDFLKYFITEDIYVIPGKEKETVQSEGTHSQEKHTKRSYPLTVLSSKLEKNEWDLLEKILSSVNINIDEIQLPEGEQKDILGKKVLVFDSNTYPDLALYQPTTVDHIPVLKSDPLKALGQDVEKKKKLWVCMKPFFDLQ